MLIVRVSVTVAIAFFCLPAAAQPVGETIYKRHCAGCHELNHPNIPPRPSLARMSSARILRTLDFGTMLWIAAPLQRSEREAVASFLASAANNRRCHPRHVAPPRRPPGPLPSTGLTGTAGVSRQPTLDSSRRPWRNCPSTRLAA